MLIVYTLMHSLSQTVCLLLSAGFDPMGRCSKQLIRPTAWLSAVGIDRVTIIDPVIISTDLAFYNDLLILEHFTQQH